MADGGLADVGSAPQFEVIEEWGVFNDPDFLEPRFASGEIHPLLREKLLEEPLWTSELPGPAKRFQQYFNNERLSDGRYVHEGLAVLRMRTTTRTKWRTVTERSPEWDDIDDGRRANG